MTRLSSCTWQKVKECMSNLIEGLKHDQEIPEGWERLDYLCRRDTGSKAYEHKDGAGVHVVDLYNTHKYTVLLVESNGKEVNEDVNTYKGAIVKAVELMEDVHSSSYE